MKPKAEQLMTEGEHILDAIRQVQLQLECVRSSFADATNEILIDSYIYEIIALQKKYEYFLKSAKALGLTHGYQKIG